MKIRRPHVIAWSIAIFLAGSAYVYSVTLGSSPMEKREIPHLGEPGSTHAHATLLVMDRDKAVSFCEKKYMLASQLVHFEDDNCVVVHKHATGVTLDTFFKSIEVALSEKCLVIPGKISLCDDAKNTLRVVVNGGEVAIPELKYYELKNNDHILINFGPEEGALLRFKYNMVPNVPADVNIPTE